jgi:hypothetical protein
VGHFDAKRRAHRVGASNLVDVQNRLKETHPTQVFALISTVCLLVLAGTASIGHAQASVAAGSHISGPPPSSVGIFPLSQVHRGLRGVAWTVFEGTTPEPMDVEILGVLRGAIGPGRDMILARLHGEKPEYTGVVAGMSGSPVYVEGKLLGALSYRIGQFSKEPIAGITPIEAMLEVRDMPEADGTRNAAQNMAGEGKLTASGADGQPTFAAMETPLLMSGFQPEAIRVWKERMAGTGLDLVSAGGAMGTGSAGTPDFDPSAPVVPGSAVSLELARGDLEIAATCTVTYVDPKQLLACGHPVLQAGAVSLPMTTAEVLATLASPLNAFKIINTGRTIGAFTEDRAEAISGQLGAKARMIPVSITIANGSKTGEPAKSTERDLTERHVEVLDQPSMTPSVVLVSVYQILLETNQSSPSASYHVTGEIALSGQPPIPLNAWGTPSDTMASQLAAAFAVGDAFNRLYSNASRLRPVEGVKLHIEMIPHDLRTELESVRVISSGIVHAGDTVTVEATIRPFQQAARNVRLPITLPARLEPGNVRLLVSGAAALDRTLDAIQPARVASLDAATARLRGLHDASRLYVSLLLPESQASEDGVTLESLPLSMANTLEPQRSGSEVALHGESLVVAAEASAGGVLSGQQLLTLRIESGGGLH